MSGPLLTTKLFIPPSRATLVPRSRLLARLNAEHPLTLLSAAAGFGKTTLLSEWIRQSKHCVAWISLDESDNDPSRFWLYIIAALQTLRVDLGANALSLLQLSQTPPTTSILTTLINEIISFPDDFSIVLDDYHVIHTQPIHDGMTFLLEHLPRNMKVIISSRTDPPLPLPRFRARAQLTEFRADDLRFTSSETAAFLNHVMSLNLSEVDITALEARTEGWIAGLQLAAISMQGRDDVSGFISAFKGNHRYIVDYLIEEVLSRQSESLQSLLLQTSILERMCASLCEAVTEQTEGEAMLMQLEDANLFVVALDHKRQWFRYHPLFAEALQTRLRETQQGHVLELHQRASAWFDRNGFPSEAIQHGLAAQDFDHVARLIEDHAMMMAVSGQSTTVRSWLSALPSDLRRPGLSLAGAWADFNSGWLSSIERHLQDAEGLLAGSSQETDKSIRGQIAALRALNASFYGEQPRAMEFAQDALDDLPEQPGSLRLAVTAALAYSHFQAGDLAAAEQAAMTVLTSQEAPFFGPQVSAQLVLCFIRRSQGQLREAFRVCQQLLSLLAPDGHPLPTAGTAQLYYELGSLFYEQNHLEEAEHHFMVSREVSEAVGFVPAQAHACAGLARLAQAQGDPSQANSLMAQAEALFNQHAAPNSQMLYQTQRAALWLAQGQLELAAQWAETQALALESQLVSLNPFDSTGLILARIWIAYGQPARALDLLTTLLHTFESNGHHQSSLWALILRALALKALGRAAEALDLLQRALITAEPEGYVRSFIDEGEPMRMLLVNSKLKINNAAMRAYIDKLIGAFGHVDSSPPANVVNMLEPLRARELEVLRLIAEGYSNREIAEKLIIGLGTVKTHINNLFRKLEVDSRTRAIARARELGLLSPEN